MTTSATIFRVRITYTRPHFIWETYLPPIIQNDTRIVLILPVPRHPLAQMDRDAQLVPRVVEDDGVQLAAVAVENGRLGVHLGRLLHGDDLARVPLVDAEAVVAQVYAQRPQARRHGAVGPAVEDAAGVGAEGDDVAEGFEF